MNASSQKPRYRPEIEGLRTVAASLVAVSHVWVGGVSGGVDAFFVVSGFLVTLSLLSQQRQTGRINPIAFWAGLARRLFPIALLVAFFTAVAGIVFLPQVLWIDTIRHAAASLVYLENWQLAFDAVDYLAQGMEATPYQQYWALSVQGQFYLLWPIIFMALFHWPKLKVTPLRLGGCLLLLFLASLTYSILTTENNQAFAYYDTAARAWEFTLGALLALLIDTVKIGKYASFILGWLGLLGLLSCGFILNMADRFPGYVALLPTLSAAFIILSGNHSTYGSAAVLLAKKPLARLGAYSYAFYLWHWPVLIFYRHATNEVSISLIEGVIVIAVAFLLAVLSTQLLEVPIRNSSLKSARPIRTFALMFFMAFPAGGVLAGWTAYTKEALLEDIALLDVDDPVYLGARAVDRESSPLEQGNVYPSPINARRDRPKPYMDQCQQKSYKPDLLRCVYGKKTAGKVIAIVGGSHSVQWLPAFEAFADKDDIKLVNFTKNFCLFSSPAGFGDVYTHPSCTAWNASLMEELVASKPDLVFTTYTRDGGENEYVPLGYLDWFRKLDENGIRVLAVRDNPWLPFEPSKCIEVYGADSAKCSVPRDTVLARIDPIKAIKTNLGNTTFVDYSRFFCDESVCFPTMGNVLIYRDSNHITGSYMRTLSPYLRQKVALALNKAL